MLASLFIQVLIDGPQSETGVHRQVIALKRVALTDLVVTNIKRNSKLKSLKSAWTVKICFWVYYMMILIFKSKDSRNFKEMGNVSVGKEDSFQDNPKKFERLRQVQSYDCEEAKV